MDCRLVLLSPKDAGEVLTLQRAAYVTEAQAHADVNLPPLRQSLAELIVELSDPQVLAMGWRDSRDRLVAAVRARTGTPDDRVAEVGRLTVVPDRQGQQLGSRLLATIEEQLPGTVTELRLFTGEHSDGNLRLGYSESSRTDTPAGYDLVHLRKIRTLPNEKRSWHLPRRGRARRAALEGQDRCAR